MGQKIITQSIDIDVTRGRMEMVPITPMEEVKRLIEFCWAGKQYSDVSILNLFIYAGKIERCDDDDDPWEFLCFNYTLGGICLVEVDPQKNVDIQVDDGVILTTEEEMAIRKHVAHLIINHADFIRQQASYDACRPWMHLVGMTVDEALLWLTTYLAKPVY